MKNLLFFKPIGRFALWGIDAAKNYFGYDEFPDGIGQFWSFSGQDKDSNICLSEPFENQTLKQIWVDHPELFKSRYIHFPFIISLVGAEDNLSIQVHPDDEKAQKLGYEMGKNEAWYFLDSKPEVSIFYGTSAQNKEELMQAVADKNFETKLLIKKVETGSFVYLPAGLIHAMGKGNVAYEIQQSTDVTYRLFDFNRKDNNGKERELNLDKGLECIDFKQEYLNKSIMPDQEIHGQSKVVKYQCEDSFIVYRFEVKDFLQTVINKYLVCTVCKGEGLVNGEKVQLGDSFLIVCGINQLNMSGDMVIMATSEV